MNKVLQTLDKIRIVPAISVVAILGIGAYLASNTPDEKQQDGIVFEKDGTAVAGRESGKDGWLDLICNESGRVVVKVVNSYGWEVVSEDSFQDDSCEDGKLEEGEISADDIPKSLQG